MNLNDAANDGSAIARPLMVGQPPIRNETDYHVPEF